MGKRIDTILFDLGNVLIGFDFGVCYARWEAISGLPPSEIRSRLSKTDLYKRFETGLIASEPFALAVQETVGFGCAFAQFCQDWNSIFFKEPLVPQSVLAILRRRYRLLVVSNTNAIHFEMLRRTYPILSEFEGFVVSYEVGAMKPDPRYYSAVLEKTGCRAERCLFIDDLPANVEGARLAGMDAVPFTTFENLKTQLRIRGIDCE